MNINAAVTTHLTVAEIVNRSVKWAQKYYDTNPEMASNMMRPLIILGKPGIGKTVGIRELAEKKLKIGFKELRLASMSELDLAGLPMVRQDDDGVSETTYAASKLLPKEKRDGEYGILVLDEISSCSRAARAVALQLLDSSRGVGEYKLPDKWICVGLGNDADDGGIFEGLEGAFLNRCRCVRLEPDYPSWEVWADDHGINPSVKAFLKCYPQRFYEDPIEGDTRICASPRAWEGVATQLDFAEELAGGRVDANDTEMFLACIASDVTPDIAAQFAAFYAYNSEMIPPEKVLSGAATLEGKDAGAKESVYLTIEASIALLLKKFKDVPANKISSVKLEAVSDKGKSIVVGAEEMVANYVRFMGMLQKSKGGEAAASGLEQLCRRVSTAVQMLGNANFRTKHPDEFSVLVNTAKRLTNL